MNHQLNSLRLIRLLYSNYNRREIATVCDFELYYGLLCDKSSGLHLLLNICEELSRFPGIAAFKTVKEDDTNGVEGSIKDFVHDLGYEGEWQDTDSLVECLLEELLCCRVEYKKCYQQALYSREFCSNDIVTDDIANMIKEKAENAAVSVEDDVKYLLESLKTVRVKDYKERLFNHKHLSAEDVVKLRNLYTSLCEEYSERWNLYLVRFDCLMKVFLAAGKPKEGEGLETLLEVINKWRNGSYSRFRQFNIYDIYRATVDTLKIQSASCKTTPSGVIELYRRQSKLGSEESYESFIKKIFIPEPPNRGGLPEGFSTKRFYSKFKKH